MKILLPILVLLGGMASAAMLEMTSRLRDTVVSPVFAVAISFAIGSAVMFVISLFGIGGHPSIREMSTAPWWAYIGGTLVAGGILFSILAKSQGSTGAVIAAAIFGQQTLALAIDHFGWMGAEKQPINAWKIAAWALLLSGAVLMGKK